MSKRTGGFLAGLAAALLGALALVEGAEGIYSEVRSGEGDYLTPLALLGGAGAASLVVGLYVSLRRLRGAL